MKNKTITIEAFPVDSKNGCDNCICDYHDCNRGKEFNTFPHCIDGYVYKEVENPIIKAIKIIEDKIEWLNKNVKKDFQSLSVNKIVLKPLNAVLKQIKELE